ncbi:Flp pilus assembly protein CpaB [Tabrizicola sp.]|uniref:Flp pilus assembly protein CpaB n=1 Tax=Tabrizicola sp. TaxID=2005166 RepID=UPI00262B98D0|nr:Flp pilus assembly protein CpaB [Tabrizicola sp.]MDM7932855.1 Flp pilus assembly protein CpaB [Tabrizicola sp.]
MRAVFGLVLVVGMALAGAAVYMIQGYIKQTEVLLQNERAFNEKAGRLVEVFVFNKPLNFGDALQEGDVQLIYWPERALPPTIFRDQAELFPENAPGPRYVMRPTEAFEPVLASRLTEPGQLAGLTAKLGAGQRAFAIRVGVASGVSGFVKPDDYIDIYWTGGVAGMNGEVTRLIESSIQIIAVDNAFNEAQTVSTGDARTVTVAATPEQVARLAQAQSTGRLSMSLVGSGDDIVTDRIEVNTDSMLGIEREQVVVEAPKEVEKVCTIKSRRGGEEVETVIPCRD